MSKQRVLILGGGFGGVTTAQELHKRFKNSGAVEITLVNRDNHFVFVPMLASAAAGSIDAMNVVLPIRSLISGVNFRAEEVIGIDIEGKRVTTRSQTTGRERILGYDHLVLALGNVIDLSRLPGVAQHSQTLKTLGDAIAIRNHALQMLEAADIESDEQTRQEMLTFVVAGGGFSGVEMVGELNDMIRDVLHHYPSVQRHDVKVVLLHSRDRILPEMPADTADYALKELRKRGVEVRLNERLGSATPREVVLQSGAQIAARTLIVAVGNAAPPVLADLPLEKARGKIVVDETMQASHPGVWALGDNAIVPNTASDTGDPSPPTAQYALRQGKTLAHNIAAAIEGAEMKPFAYGGLGLLCLFGHRAGVGTLPGGIKVTGFPAAFLWRSVYWAKFPSFGRKLQIGIDWALDTILARDTAQLNLERTRTIAQAHYEAGETIFRQGDPGSDFYMIMGGEVEVVRELPDGGETVLARLGKGDYFGETALLDSRPRNATVRTVSPVDLALLSRDDFSTLTESWEQLTRNLQTVSDQRAGK